MLEPLRLTAAPPCSTAAAAIGPAHRAADALMADLTARGPAAGCILACTPGCAACCTYTTSAFPSEAALIAEQVQQQPAAQRAATIARLYDWTYAWRAHARQRPHALPVALAWQVKRRACPLLDLTTHRCQVYEKRPVACRVHHACELPPAVNAPHWCCPIPPPRDGCFTRPSDVAHGHHTPVWQFRDDLQERGLAAVIAMFDVVGAPPEPPGVLPELVLAAGRAAFGWRHPGRVRPVPTLAHAQVRED